MRNAGPPVETRKSDVSVVLKAFDLLEALADGEWVGLTAISIRAGVTKASAYRVLNTLVGKNYVTKRDADRTYGVGPRLIELSGRFAAGRTLVSRARPVLERIHREFNETVNLGTLNDTMTLYVEILESHRELRMAARVGQKDPLHSTALGKAILAQLPEAEVDRLLEGATWSRRTPNTITSKAKFKRELTTIRELGYAVDNEENESGARCVAVAIVEGPGRCREAISVSGPRFRINDAHVERIARSLVSAAHEVEQRLGYAGRLGTSPARVSAKRVRAGTRT